MGAGNRKTTGRNVHAFHDDEAAEISGLSLVTAASGDHILIEDVSDNDNKKRVAASDFLNGAFAVDDENHIIANRVFG